MMSGVTWFAALLDRDRYDQVQRCNRFYRESDRAENLMGESMGFRFAGTERPGERPTRYLVPVVDYQSFHVFESRARRIQDAADWLVCGHKQRCFLFMEKKKQIPNVK
jgi:hypothetical protein